MRNCEEFDLFDALRNVNPFEETFRQAIKDKRTSYTKTSSVELPVKRIDDEDTLHTPNIFPYGNTPSVIVSRFDSDKGIDEAKDDQAEQTTSPPNDSVTVVPLTSEELSDPVVKCEKDEESTKTLSAKLKRQENGIRRPLRKICPKPSVAIVTVRPAAVLNPIKEKIKASLRSRSLLNEDTEGTKDKADVPQICIPLVQVKDQSTGGSTKTASKQILPKAKAIVKKEANIHGTYSQQIIKNERNRAAASRYRNKMKLRYKELLEHNNQLQMENLQLKQQLQHFKLTHKNCTVAQTVIKMSD